MLLLEHPFSAYFLQEITDVFDPEKWHASWMQEYPQGRKRAQHRLEIGLRAPFPRSRPPGLDIFDAAKGLPVPEMNRERASQAQMRRLYASP
jgi:hypothetical protein